MDQATKNQEPYYLVRDFRIISQYQPLPIEFLLPKRFERITGAMILADIFPNHEEVQDASIGHLWATIDNQNTFLIPCENDRVYDYTDTLIDEFGYPFRLDTDQCYCLKPLSLPICNSRLKGQYFNHLKSGTFVPHQIQLILALS